MIAHVVSLHTGWQKGEREGKLGMITVSSWCKHWESLSPQSLVQFFWERLLVEWCVWNVSHLLSSLEGPSWLHCGYIPAVCSSSLTFLLLETFLYPLGPRGQTGGASGERQPPGKDGKENYYRRGPGWYISLHTLSAFLKTHLKAVSLKFKV